MQVIADATIVGLIENAITSAVNAIKRIEVTQAEMDTFVKDPKFSMHSIDKNYAGYEIAVPLGIKTHAGSASVKSCWYMQTLITVV